CQTALPPQPWVIESPRKRRSILPSLARLRNPSCICVHTATDIHGYSFFRGAGSTAVSVWASPNSSASIHASFMAILLFLVRARAVHGPVGVLRQRLQDSPVHGHRGRVGGLPLQPREFRPKLRQLRGGGRILDQV